MASKEVEYNVKKLSRYEGEQKLRSIERNIRRYKRKLKNDYVSMADDTIEIDVKTNVDEKGLNSGLQKISQKLEKFEKSDIGGIKTH